MKERKFLSRDQAVAVEHPMGGVFYLRPLSTKVLLRYREEIEKKGVAIEGDGDAMKVSVRSDVDDFQALVDFVSTRVERVTGFRDAVTNALLESTPDLIDALLWELFDVEEEAPAEASIALTGDEQRALVVTKKKTQLTASWCLNEQVKLGKASREDEAKN